MKDSGFSIAGKIFATFFLGIFAAAGLTGVVLLGWGIFDGVKEITWTAAPCQILESGWADEMLKSRDTPPEKPFSLTIRYRYEFGGESYTTDHYRTGTNWFNDARKVQKLASQYKAGSSATCWVNPKKPSEAVLWRDLGQLIMIPFLGIPLVFVAIGLGGIYKTWTSANRSGERPVSERARGMKGGLCAGIFFSVFLLAGLIFLIPFFIAPVWLIILAQTWSKVPCVVLYSDVQSHSGKGTTYSVDVHYRYRIDGNEYLSNRYDFFGGASSGRAGKQAIVNQYRRGAESTCYVNPRDPTDAVLYRGANWFMLFALLPLVFVTIGLGGLIGIWRSRRVSQMASPGRSPTLDAPVPTSSGMVELRPATTPFMKFLFMLGFAVVWNGVVGVIVSFVIRDWTRGEHKVGLAVFIGFFVLAGLILIGTVIARFVALFNPRIRLSASSGAVPLGGRLDLHWRFDGSVGRIQRMRLVLEGREEATYRRGTDTSTDKHVFSTTSLVDTDSKETIQSGHRSVVIPQTLMHTFKAPNNKIIWSIKLQGEILRSPDLDEEYPIQVLPRA